MAQLRLIGISLFVVIGAFLASYANIAAVTRAPKVLGLLRKQNKTALAADSDLIIIPDTTFCEDLHYHKSSGMLFTACEASDMLRYAWFPPLGNFDDPGAALSTQGKIHVIDPATMKSKRLNLDRFAGPFVTHGIDVLDDPEKPAGEAVYIFAVNHVPNKQYLDNKDAEVRKSRSVVEIFHHVLGSNSAQHVRTVWHNLLTTPNDILALSPTSFLATNDHFYSEGHMRTVEDLYYGAKWSNTVHITFSNTDRARTDDAHGVEAYVALDGMHNNNGIGAGKGPDEVVVVTAASGTVNFGRLERRDGRVSIHIDSTFEAESSLDNPSYFADPYANSTFDASGYIQCGLTRAGDLLGNIRDPDAKDGVMVWGIHEASMRQDGPGGPAWEGRLLFEDDGNRVRTGSAAVLVAIDPAEENGRRKAWLYVTGFLSKNVIAAKIDL